MIKIQIPRLVVSLLLIVLGTIWLAVFSSPDAYLHIVACDVGQGDAILMQNGSSQVLVDGGVGSRVLDCLGKYMPFWDRQIEIIVLTHPQADHFSGLIEVFKRFKVGYFLAPGVDNSTQGYQVLKDLVMSSQVQIVNPSEGMNVRLGKIYLDIINPTSKLLASENVLGSVGEIGMFTTTRDLNDFSVVFNLTFGSFDAILTGDIGQEREKAILTTGKIKEVEYIKIPHHGSRNGLTKEFLDATSPSVAVISVGAKNTYGHPHKEILDMLKTAGVKVLRTDEMGDVEIVTDGEKYWLH
ncbi:MAG: hypothetical protein ACD_66C00214G0001 [uncultured bacterium]|nr:MAG: hypothetical protein ACD_66C00214G0001 [uncultured bacterium]